MAPSDDIRVGDQVNVPGGMYGTVKFLGSVNGKPGRFAGIELAAEHAARGKNNGDVEGRSYFTTNISGAGIFVPINNSKYVTKRNVVTPPTPSRPSVSTNFSKSVGPPSMPRPRVRRPSLPRPESPRSAPPAKLNFAAMRSPSATVAKPTSASSLGPGGSNGFPRSPLKPPSRLSDRPPSRFSVEDESLPPALGRSTFGRPSTSGAGIGGGQETQELQEKVKKLEQELQARDRQLDDQASALSELQQSITELEGVDGASMRTQLREKNEKIAQLTAEFDSHRADFRSTLDTLEVAATETERVYEKRLDELMQQNRELQDRGEDVEAVAQQLKQLEDLVSELEEGLEDARRGEAEARGEVEFLRGEVERAQLELQQEREKSAAALRDAEGRRNSRELDQKDDEIRGLKAIIHSLSRGDVNPALLTSNGASHAESSSRDAEKISQLEERIKELEGVAETRSTRIEELQKEIGQDNSNRNSVGWNSPKRSSSGRNSMQWMNGVNGARSRSGTVTIAPLRQMKSSHSARGSRSSNPVSHGHSLSDRTVVPPDWQESGDSPSEQGPLPVNTYQGLTSHREDNDDSHDSDIQSSENGSLWCEICETKGHDILTCTTFGGATTNGDSTNQEYEQRDHDFESPKKEVTTTASAEAPARAESPVNGYSHQVKEEPAEVPSPTVKTGRDAVLEGLTSSTGPVAGKASGIVDESKWCALCERDGHESIDCPFDD